jgi:RNA polymerase primary sigma factor
MKQKAEEVTSTSGGTPMGKRRRFPSLSERPGQTGVQDGWARHSETLNQIQAGRIQSGCGVEVTVRLIDVSPVQALKPFMVTDRYNESSDTIQLYLREIGETPLLTREEEIKLAARVKRGDKRARERMIKANLRLVVKISHDYAKFGLPLLDLISEGNIGLMKAVERFNPRKGAKLSTYAALWIKQSIRRALSNQSKTIRLPVHVVDKVHKLQRARVELTESLGREPNDGELAEHLGLAPAKVAQLRTYGVTPTSLDAPIGDEDDHRFGDIVEDEGAFTPYELLRVKMMRQEIRQHIKYLTPREAEIIAMRFGLDGQPPRTLDEVGKKFKVTRERIRQIQELALGKLRRRIDALDNGDLVGKS